MERAQLRQRLDWTEALLPTERQRPLKALGDAADLRRQLAQRHQERASSETVLALANRALHSLRADSALDGGGQAVGGPFSYAATISISLMYKVLRNASLHT